MPGVVKSFENSLDGKDVRIPHMGWNTVCFDDPNIREAITVDGEAGFIFCTLITLRRVQTLKRWLRLFMGKSLYQ